MVNDDVSGTLPTSASINMRPVLSVDVNLGGGIAEKIIVYEGETAKQVSERLSRKFTLS